VSDGLHWRPRINKTKQAQKPSGEKANFKHSQDRVSNELDAAQTFSRIVASASAPGVGGGTAGAVVASAFVGTKAAIDSGANREQLGQGLRGASLRRPRQIHAVRKPNLLALGLDIGRPARLALRPTNLQSFGPQAVAILQPMLQQAPLVTARGDRADKGQSPERFQRCKSPTGEHQAE